MSSLGIIVIGRNEGVRLKRAMKSLSDLSHEALLYVDSGSTDGSVELAKSLGVQVHVLDTSKAFSAARARREGTTRLLEENPHLLRIQFLDGDCELCSEWPQHAVQYLELNDDVGIVCGRLIELAPESSIYNRFNSLQWNAELGEIHACGGNFMIRRDVYEQSGGFNDELLTGEESDLCQRVRENRYRIIRIDQEMASHDSGLTTFRQWWQRAVWGGYGDALAYSVLGGRVSPKRRRATQSSLIWAILIPLLGLAGLIGMAWSLWFMFLFTLSAVAYVLVLIRIAIPRFRRGDSPGDATLYACLCLLRKFPNTFGYALYFFGPKALGSQPDAHAAVLPSNRDGGLIGREVRGSERKSVDHIKRMERDL